MRPRRRPRPPPRKPPPFWSARKWKLYLFALWLAGTAFWLPVAAERSHMGFVADTYSLYWHYEKSIQDGGSTRYTRTGFRKAEEKLRDADRYIFSFIVTGIVWPLLVLAGGAWLLRKAK